MLTSLDAGKGFIHWPAFALLEGWGIADNDVRDRLGRIVRDETMNSRIAHLLPRIVDNVAECRHLLMSILANEQCSRPDFVIQGLKQIGATLSNPEACLFSLRHLNNAKGVRLHEVTHGVLTAFPDDPRVREVALGELRNPDGEHSAVAQAFGRDQEIRHLVLRRLTPLPVRLRELIVGAFAERASMDKFARDQLELFPYEHNPEVKTKACIAYYRTLANSQDIPGYVIEGLLDAVRSTRLQDDGRRQAGFCGLVELGRIDVFRDAREQLKDTHCSVPLDNFENPNVPLLHCIGRNWEALRKVMGESLETRLVDRFEPSRGVPWDALSVVATQYPALSEELLEKVESDASLPITENILRFVAATRPRSLLLRQKCVECLRGEKQRMETAVAAAEFLSTFYRDPSTFSDFLNLIPVRAGAFGRAFAAFLGLADAWPDSHELDVRAAALKGQVVPWVLCFALSSQKTNGADSFVSMLADLCRSGGVRDLTESHRIFKYCVRYVLNSDECYQNLLVHCHASNLG